MVFGFLYTLAEEDIVSFLYFGSSLLLFITKHLGIMVFAGAVPSPRNIR